jgi:hypothetical protein
VRPCHAADRRARRSRTHRTHLRGSTWAARGRRGPGTSASNIDCWPRDRGVTGRDDHQVGRAEAGDPGAPAADDVATVTPEEEGRHRTFLLLGVGAVDGLEGAVSQGDLEGRHGTTVRPAGYGLGEGQPRGFWWHNRVRFWKDRRVGCYAQDALRPRHQGPSRRRCHGFDVRR